MSVHSRGIKPAIGPDTDALTKAPPVPKHLAPHAKAEWRRIMPQLIDRRIITKGDLAGVESYCAAVGAVRTIADTMSAGGL